MMEKLWGCHQDLEQTADCLGDQASDLDSMIKEIQMRKKVVPASMKTLDIIQA